MIFATFIWPMISRHGADGIVDDLLIITYIITIGPLVFYLVSQKTRLFQENKESTVDKVSDAH